MYQRERVEKRRTTEHLTITNISAIRDYQNSKARENILHAVGNYTDDMALTTSVYYNFRSILIGEIILRIAQRSGVACGLMVSEEDAGKEQNDKLRIKIYTHKTGKVKPAAIFFNKLATKALLIFRTTILNKMELTTSGHQFLSDKGNKLTNAGVKSALKTCLRLTGFKGNITATLSRIAAATFMATNKSQNSQVSADFM